MRREYKRYGAAMSMGDFFLCNYCIGTIMILVLQKISNHILKGLQTNVDIWSVLLCIFVSCGVGTLWMLKNRRTIGAVFYNVMIGGGLYTMLSYECIQQQVVNRSITVALLVTTINIVFIQCRKIPSEAEVTEVKRTRMKNCMRIAQRNLGLAGLVIVVVLPIMANEQIHFSETTGAVIYNQQRFYGDDYKLSNQVESISKIRKKESWSHLSKKEKLKVLQDICNCEIRYLGIGHKITVETAEFERTTMRGCYIEKEYKIQISEQTLDNHAQSLEVLLHEVYHAYQYELCKVYADLTPEQRSLQLFENASVYVEEFQTYVTGGEDMNTYESQWVEEDARWYATHGVEQYYEEIDKLLEL